NLLFRTLALISVGVKPVFVLEGEAPHLKWATINSRNQRTHYDKSTTKNNTEASKKTATRSRFKSVLKECKELLDLLGVSCVQAEGEAEATCASLSYHQVVEGVISQDSDVFLYGGKTVFRNFTASHSKATLEKYSVDLMEAHLELTRGDMIMLALLLGCDYRPQGVPGIGKDTALKFIQLVHRQGENDPIGRLKLWAGEPSTDHHNIKLSSTKWKNGSDDDLEYGVRVRLEAEPDFPFTDVIHEFERHLSPPIKKVVWHRPNLEGLVKWCMRKLGWEADYALEKICPAVTRWVVSKGSPLTILQAVSVLKHCVRQGVPSCLVEWQLSCPNLNLNQNPNITTVEPFHLIQSSFPNLVQQFEEKTAAKKKGKARKKDNIKKKTKNTSSRQTHLKSVREYFTNTPEPATQSTTVTEQQCDLDIKTYNETTKVTGQQMCDNYMKTYNESTTVTEQQQCDNDNKTLSTKTKTVTEQRCDNYMKAYNESTKVTEQQQQHDNDNKTLYSSERLTSVTSGINKKGSSVTEMNKARTWTFKSMRGEVPKVDGKQREINKREKKDSKQEGIRKLEEKYGQLEKIGDQEEEENGKQENIRELELEEEDRKQSEREEKDGKQEEEEDEDDDDDDDDADLSLIINRIINIKLHSQPSRSKLYIRENMGKMKNKKANKKGMAEQPPMSEKEKKKIDKKKSESRKNDSIKASLDRDEDEVFQSTRKTKRKYEDIVTAPETSPKKSKKKKKLNNMEALYDSMKSPPSTSKKKKQKNSDDNVPQNTQPTKVKKEKKMVDDNQDFPDGNMEDLEKENTNTPTTKSKTKKNMSPMVMLPRLPETGKEKPVTPVRRTPKLEEFSPPRVMKRHQEQEDLNSSSSSPRKKKRKSMLVGDASSSELPNPLLKVPKVKDDHHIRGEEEVKKIWSKDETRALLDRIEEQLPPKDRRGYRTCMNKMDWGSVATDNRSDEECRLKLLNLISRFLRLLTMKEMMQNLRNLVDEGRAQKQIRRPSALNLFTKHFLSPRQREKIRAKNSKEPMLSFVVKAWRKLPPEQQQIFKMQAEEKKLEWDRMTNGPRKLNRKIKTGLVLSPYKAWLEEQIKAEVTDNKILTKDYFNKLSDQEKVPYITTSIQTYYRKFIEDGKDGESIKMEEEDGDEEEEKASTKQCRVALGVGLPKSDLLIYLKYKEMPTLPPSTPARYYHSELTKNGDLSEVSTSQAMEMYRQLSAVLKKTYNTQHAELLWKLKPVLESWMQKQDPVTVFAMRQYMGPFVHKYLLTTKATMKNVKNVQNTKAGMEELFPNVTHSSITCPKFHNEPQRPPFTPYQLFCLQFKQATEGKFATFKDQNQARNKKWKKMSAEKRKAYTEHLQRLQKSYRSEVVEFVSDMDKKMRLVYLGFNRMRHYQYFKEDIFQDLFPNQKYPVYGMKNPTLKQESFFGDGGEDAISLDIKSEEGSGEEEDEEEEEESDDDDDSVDFGGIPVDIVESGMNGKNKTSGEVVRKTTKQQQSPTKPQQQQQQKHQQHQHDQSEENSSEEEEEEDDDDDDDDEDDEKEEEDDEKEEEDDDEEEEEEEEEDIPVMPRKRAVKSDSPKKTQSLPTPQRYPKKEESSSSSSESDDDDDDDDDEQRPPTTSTPGSATRVQRPPPYPNADVSDDDSDSDSDDFRNNSILPVYRTAKGAAVVSSAHKTASISSDSDSDSD
ncbi:hypothetical protein Pcinc_008083, partial [Petrolisthes cinctipes]